MDTIVTSAAVGAAKPDPAVILEALRRLDCAPERALFVGDSPRVDVPAAAAAGVRSVMIERPSSALLPLILQEA